MKIKTPLDLAHTRAAARTVKRTTLGIVDTAYRAKNRRKPKILVYTDSRGQHLANRLGKMGWGSYVLGLRSSYQLTYRICPEKYTTIIDFLDFIDQTDVSHYTAIVLHCGIVDFSPRPISGIDKVRESKSASMGFKALFLDNAEYYAKPFDCDYYGEKTINLYSPDYLRAAVLPRLVAIPQLIWINSNRFVPGWEGNYVKGRPGNIGSVVTQFDAVMADRLPRLVDLHHWTPDQVRTYTMDNIHFTSTGFARIQSLVDKAIQLVVAEA